MVAYCKVNLTFQHHSAHEKVIIVVVLLTQYILFNAWSSISMKHIEQLPQLFSYLHFNQLLNYVTFLLFLYCFIGLNMNFDFPVKAKGN